MPSKDIQLDLTIDDEAATHTCEKGGVLTIRTRPQHGCCGGRVDRATVSTEPPGDPEPYVQTEQDGVTVYVHRSFASLDGEPIRVGLDQLWIWQSLYVKAASRM
ncbi:CC/Se motif family (seleno)protein [Salinibacter grassmerensis]|uniref:CC/Se motif family (seleno)protein n=1 Tax=Salinibacter grassmerensis TaxID=3040353 RepID=UPI0021E7800A|nr:CC/Se motif family (seleno)protein [Salinibacter grassmerensis]